MPTLGVLIAKCTLTHIGKLDGTLGAGIHEPVAGLRMELSSCNNFGQFFHVSWFDVDNVEALILDIQIPQIYSEIIATDEGLSITIDRDAVDMISMSVSICTTRNGCNYSIVMCHARKLEVCGTGEKMVWS
jgi:hypothetical protein